MFKQNIIVGAVIVAMVSAGALFFLWYVNGNGNESANAFIDPSDKALVAQGKIIYASYCAACHGMNLEGQPDWRKRLPNGRLPAPPHDETGHTWHHPDAVLFNIVKHGLVPGKTAPDNYESDMPAYDQVLSDTDIVAVLAYIKSTWSRETLALQKSVTLQEGRQ